jgi:hypothetical protein
VNFAFAQTAGKVLLSVGDVSVVRGGERIRLVAGATVGAGDSVVTGADSYAQIRFSDDALVALKPDTEFRIERFNFTGRQDGSEAAVFRLVRGGFRTLTGQIGKLNRDQYQLLTTQATIGIRGTHYQVQICAAGQCRNRGAEVGAGMYGGAYEGGVVVANGFGSGEFGADEFFYVPDGQAPLRWLGPPAFLSDKLERRARVARTAPTELRFAKVPETAPPPALPLAPFTFMATEDLGSGLLALGQTIVVGSDRYTLELDSTSNPDLQLGIVGGALHSFHNGSLSADLGSAALTDVGSDGSIPSGFAAGSGLNWGRWSGPGSTITQALGNQVVQRWRQTCITLWQYRDGAADIRTGFVRGGRRHAADRFGHRRRRYAGVRRHGQRQLHHRSTRASVSPAGFNDATIRWAARQHHQWPLPRRRRRAATSLRRRRLSTAGRRELHWLFSPAPAVRHRHGLLFQHPHRQRDRGRRRLSQMRARRMLKAGRATS